MNRAVVSIDDSVSPPVYKLVVEGDDFDKVMSTYGVDFTRTKSNNTFEVLFHGNIQGSVFFVSLCGDFQVTQELERMEITLVFLKSQTCKFE